MQSGSKVTNMFCLQVSHWLTCLQSANKVEMKTEELLETLQ